MSFSLFIILPNVCDAVCVCVFFNYFVGALFVCCTNSSIRQVTVTIITKESSNAQTFNRETAMAALIQLYPFCFSLNFVC